MQQVNIILATLHYFFSFKNLSPAEYYPDNTKSEIGT